MRINLRGFFVSTSYGLCALNVLKALIELGHEVSVFPAALDGSDIPPQFHESLRQGLANAYNWDVNAPCVSITHQNMMAECVSRRRVGWPIFELDTFTQLEKHHLASLDQIIVCSHWAKDVCRKNGLTQPINVVPLGVDTSIFYPNGKPRNPNDGPTVFLTIGKKEIRKLHDKLYQYFEKAFTAEDNVELWVAWGNRILDQRNPKESSDWTNLYSTSKLNKKIRLFEWLPTQMDVANLLRKADCYVGLSRAEGWNLDLLEAMATGLTCITNYYSGHTEFVNKNNGFTIPYRVSEVAYDGTWFFGNGNWMAFEEPEEEQIVDCMREYHKTVKHIGGWFGQENLNIAKSLSWKNTATKLIEAVQ